MIKHKTSFPRDWKEFAKWRKAQNLSPYMETMAQLVENDLRLLPNLTPSINPMTMAAIESHLLEFEAKLKTQRNQAVDVKNLSELSG